MSAAAPPPLSEITKSSYAGNIDRFKRLGINPADTDKTMEYIKSMKSMNTQKTYIVSVLKWIADDPALETQRTFYREKVREMNASLLDTYKDQKLSETEKKKYADWPFILETAKQLYADPYVGDDDKLLVALYTELPPVRVDYTNLRVLRAAPSTDEGNYVVLRRKNAYIKLNNHKTAKYGAIVNKLTPALKRRFMEYARDHPTTTTLFEMEENAMSKRITRIFRRYSDKKIGVNILRHSYISHFLSKAPSLRDMEDLATRMGHSIALQQLYRKMKDEKGSESSSDSDSD